MCDLTQRTQEIIEAGKELCHLGMVPATSGNLSARLADGNIAITVSGRHKGKLTEAEYHDPRFRGKPIGCATTLG